MDGGDYYWMHMQYQTLKWEVFQEDLNSCTKLKNT